ncbi:MAG: hypothetical protein ACW9XH_07930 [Candidatus Nitrosopumilus sp. bin_32a]
MPERTENYQPKSVIWREVDYAKHIQQSLGVLDFDTSFDNQFQKWKLMIQFIDDVSEAIRQEIIPLKSKNRLDLIPDKLAIDKMDKIWNGQTYLRVRRNHEGTKVLGKELFYEKPDPIFQLKDKKGIVIDTFETEIIPMPKLKNMIPVGRIDSDTWGIRIRETMPLKYAFEGATYATVITDGNFIHHLPDGAIPKFEEIDMNSLIKRTPILHRSIYDKIMEILPMHFNMNYHVFAANAHKIMQWMEEEKKNGIYGKNLESDSTSSNDVI